MQVSSALRRVVFVVAGLAIVPASAFAQNANASISGTVKDASGAVLPGVTVEASSPVLIEKVRTSVTEGTGSTGSSTCSAAPTRSPSRCPGSRPSSARASS